MKQRMLAAICVLFAGLVVAIVGQSPARAAAQCWTWFDPPRPPAYGAMTQFYKNCDPNHGTWVLPYHTAPSGVTIYSKGCKLVGPGETVLWRFISTDPANVHSTAYCGDILGYEPGLTETQRTSTTSDCWTQFTYHDQNIAQYYRNCSTNNATVTTVFFKPDGSLIAGETSCEQVPGESLGLRWQAKWMFIAIPSASYTTAYCDGYPF